MPISTPIPLQSYSQEEFGNIAYEVVQCAFQVHNELGRIFHENIYRSTMQRMLGSRAIQELQIHLSHENFQKDLYLDLLVDLGCPFELKATTALNNAHQSQLIQYLMLTGLTHGKLINFGTERIEHRFVNSHETLEQRRCFQVERIDWSESEITTRIEQLAVSLVRDWGTGLSRSLYQEAVFAMVSGNERCDQFAEARWQGHRTGQQPAILVDPFVALEITCKNGNLEPYEIHLHKFLNNTDLKSIVWINIISGLVRLQHINRQ